MGIEALSRGAAHATFVESDGLAIKALRDESGEHRPGRSGDSPPARRRPRFRRAVDVAFVDPPYGFDGWTGLLDTLDAELAVIESDRELDVGAKWLVNKVRHYGGTVVTLAKRKGAT